MNKFLPALVAGFAASVLSVIPIIKGLSCCFIIPFAGFISLYLYQKSNNDYTRIIPSKAIFYGLLTGIFAAVFTTFFESLFLYVSRSADLSLAVSEIQKLFSDLSDSEIYEEMMDSLYQIVNEINENGFSATYTVSMLFVALIIDSIFGIIGALVGMQYLNKKNLEQR